MFKQIFVSVKIRHSSLLHKEPLRKLLLLPSGIRCEVTRASSLPKKSRTKQKKTKANLGTPSNSIIVLRAPVRQKNLKRLVSAIETENLKNLKTAVHLVNYTVN